MDEQQPQEIAKKVRDAFSVIFVNSIINSYAIENVTMGQIRQREKIPFDKYVKELRLNAFNPYVVRYKMLQGVAIDENEQIADKARTEFLYEFFITQIGQIFLDSNKTSRNKSVNNDLYLEDLFNLFTKIIDIDIQDSCSDNGLINANNENGNEIYKNVAHFLMAIKTKGLRQGKCVDRYLKKLPSIPCFAARLVKFYKGRYILINNEPDSLDFKLAVFSVFHFINNRNRNLFISKMKKWEQINKSY